MQAFLQTLDTFRDNYLYWMHMPNVNPTDIVEIIIITFLFYQIMVWIKNTKAWTLFKGILILLAFVLVAAIFQMNTILWIAEKTVSVGIIAAFIIFQPELRKALEQLGRKKFFTSFFMDSSKNDAVRFSEKTVNELVKATFEMAKVKTGALMVIEKEDKLTEYERTGIPVDGLISNQLMINIFEHNTPLHDGAVIIRGNRVVSATCYLPLSDNITISKELGTRHRAAVGISEASDSVTIVVSEETGNVSVAEGGILDRDLSQEQLKQALMTLQKKYDVEPNRFLIWKKRKVKQIDAQNTENTDK